MPEKAAFFHLYSAFWFIPREISGLADPGGALPWYKLAPPLPPRLFIALVWCGTSSAGRGSFYQLLNGRGWHQQELAFWLLYLLNQRELLSLPVIRRLLALGDEIQCRKTNGSERRKVLRACGNFLYQERTLSQGLQFCVIVAPSDELSAQARLRGGVVARRRDEFVDQLPKMPGGRAFQRDRIHEAIQRHSACGLGGCGLFARVVFDRLAPPRRRGGGRQPLRGG